MVNMIKQTPVKIKQQQGAALLEALIAVLIFSLGVIALAGLQAVMIKNTDDGRYRAQAMFAAQKTIGEIMINARQKAALTDYVETNAALNDTTYGLPDGKRTVAIDGNREVTVTISWQVPGQDAHNFTTTARVEGGAFPAPAT